MDEGTYVEPSRLTVGAWLDTWLDEYAKNAVKLSTFNTYSQTCRLYIKPKLAAVKLSALTAPAVQNLINSLHNGGATKKGLSPKSVKCIHGVLHKALEQAIKLGYIRANPADACQLPRIVKKEIKPLDKEQIHDFLDAIRGHEFETLYLVTLFTGIRQSECIGLRWQCVDFDNGNIVINAQIQRNRKNGEFYFENTTKNDRVRRITPAKFIMTALKKHRVEQYKARLLAGEAWTDSDYVFTNALGEHLKHGNVYKKYKRIVSDLGIPSARYHDLRHSYAVSALQAGDDVKTVQENLGHHTAAFTLDQYGHVTEQMKRESSARMDNFIRGIMQGS
jgi:integrase